MSREQELVKVLGENASDMGYVVQAGLLFTQNLARIQLVDILMIRGASRLENTLEVLGDRRNDDLRHMSTIAACMSKCLESVSCMMNGRDMDDDITDDALTEATNRLVMIVDKQIKNGG